MREPDFRAWLESDYRTPRGAPLEARSRTSLISTVRRVEAGLGDLDEHWRRDRGREALDRLTYTRNDAEYGRTPRHGVAITGDPTTGSASLKRAAAIYFEFCRVRPAPSGPVGPTVTDALAGS